MFDELRSLQASAMPCTSHNATPRASLPHDEQAEPTARPALFVLSYALESLLRATEVPRHPGSRRERQPSLRTANVRTSILTALPQRLRALSMIAHSSPSCLIDDL